MNLPLLGYGKIYAHLDALKKPGCEYRKSPLVPAEVKKNCLLFMGIPIFFSGMLSGQRALDLG